MTVDIALINAKIFAQGRIVEAGIAIDEGKIVKIARDTNLESASTTMNLNGQIVLPGLIDSHVHLRDQELAYKEDFFTGTASAAAGGVTLVIDMPNNRPVTMDSTSLKERMKIAEKKVLVNVAFNAAFPKQLEEIAEVVKAGAVGFKVYLANQIGGIDVDDDESLFAAFREVSEKGIPIAVHAEDRKIVDQRRKEMEMAGQNGTDAFMSVHSVKAEVQSIQRIIRLVKKSGVKLHFCHISSALGLNAVLIAKKEGSPVTSEVTPHNLLLSSEQYEFSGNFALTVPPLRPRDDVSVLWSALRQGFINVVASDHAPHALDEKKGASVWEAKPGIPGLETTLSLFLTQVNEGRLSFGDLVRVTAEEPAAIFNLSNRGFLKEGNWADLVVVDMKREYEIDSSVFFSKAKYSPFDGMQVKGKPVKTFVNGKLVMDEGEIVAESGSGQTVRNSFVLM